VIAILGAGPHGKQIAVLNPVSVLYDDYLPKYEPCGKGALIHEYLIGAFWPHVRQAIYDKLPVGSTAYQGGRVVFPDVWLGLGSQLGEHVHVLPKAVISHGCQIGDFVTIGALAGLAGDVTVESGAFIGMGAQIRHGGITIGRNAVVGMGAVVVEDVPEGATVFGNPAKVRVPA
jgi:acetyltransferase-like isoleucine patch superfamily enzyme